MRVELHHTIAPQLVLANPTARVVEVLDPDGVAFLRIGPEGVEANLAARAWYQTYAPGMPVPASAGTGGEARWRKVHGAPSFGWFDPRLESGGVGEGHDAGGAGGAAGAGRWSVPLRVDGEVVVLAGRFRREPEASGRYHARLTSASEIAPGVRVRLLPGRTPGLLVTNESREVLAILDEDGEPFLRVGPRGVEANVGSAAWRRSGRASLAPAGDAAGPAWQRVSTVPRFGWLDPRAAAGAGTAPPADGHAVRAFRIPLELGGRRLAVRGELAWRAE